MDESATTVAPVAVAASTAPATFVDAGTAGSRRTVSTSGGNVF
jgi:hypothetical protein